MTKVDLKDAYFKIPVHTSHRWMLCLLVRECHYQFSCLFFGLSCAPSVFTLTLKPMTTMLRELGVKAGGIHRRHSHHGGYKGASEGTYPRLGLPP